MQIRSRMLRSVFVFSWIALFSANLCAAELDLKATLPADPNIKMGVLPNQMRYWIRAHKTPPGKIGMWLHISSGSINEDDNQRGLAHYLEHLAFNGSTNFPPGTLVKFFESMGLRFGQHQNAFTSFDQTTYILSLPDTKDETVGKGLQCLADFAFGMSLLPDEIDKERGVILEEMRSRKGAQQRIVDKLLPILAPGSRLSERLPIGKEEVINAANQQRFKDYYAKWYRPDNATLLIVGDIESIPAIEKLVTENFKAWKPVENPARPADPGIQTYTAERAAVIVDPELTNAEVSAVNLSPMRKMLTVGQMRQRTVENIGTWILNRRFSELVEKGIAPFQNASVGISPFLNVSTYTNAEASGQPDQWEPMLRILLIEIKRAREFGFLDQELEDAKKETLSSAEQSARTEGTWDKSAFLSRMNNAISEGRTPMSEAQRLELLKAMLPGVTLAEVSAAFKQNFAADKRLLLVTLPEKKDIKVPTENEILAAARKAEEAKVEALAKKDRPKSLLEKDPQPGMIVQQIEEPDLKILSATLSNGVRVHARSMDFKKDEVFVTITLGGGKIREIADTRGITDAASLALAQAATGKLPSTVIREMMTGLNVSVSGGAGEDALTVSINGSTADLEEGFRLAHLLLTEGRIEDSALKVWKETTAQALEMRKTSVEAQLMEQVSKLLSNDDVRMRPLTPEQLKELSLEEAQTWFQEVLKRAPIEAAIVGDIGREQAIKLAAKYLGSLPNRAVLDPDISKLRSLTVKKGPFASKVEVETITPRSVVLCGWRGADWQDVKDRRVLQLASQILGARLREEIREKRSLTYSISCMAHPARVYNGTGIFAAFFTADPQKAPEACKIARELMEQFAKEGPTDAEIETTRKQLKNQLETTLKEPSYWVGVLGDLDFRGTKLSDVKEVLEKMTSYTRQDVLDVLKKYVTEEGRLEVIALPGKKTEPQK